MSYADLRASMGKPCADFERALGHVMLDSGAAERHRKLEILVGACRSFGAISFVSACFFVRTGGSLIFDSSRRANL